MHGVGDTPKDGSLDHHRVQSDRPLALIVPNHDGSRRPSGNPKSKGAECTINRADQRDELAMARHPSSVLRDLPSFLPRNEHIGGCVTSPIRPCIDHRNIEISIHTILEKAPHSDVRASVESGGC